MKADIGRVTFEPSKHYERVVMQQGRVQIESDWNEQVAIFLRGLRGLAADLIGPWGGAAGAFSIDVSADGSRDFSIGSGRYYVDGILCESGADVSYLNQPYFQVPEDELLQRPDEGELNYLVYLDVWELLVTAAEDEDIREVALGGPDTAARARLVWQVRVKLMDAEALVDADCANISGRWPTLLEEIESQARGRMRARAKVSDEDIERPCAIDPRAAYRFDENALFRVEVHQPGDADTATFKWSLDNGAVVFGVERFGGTRVRLKSLGRDARLTLNAGDWVEVEFDDYVLQNRAEPLFLVEDVDYSDLTVTLDREPAPVAAAQHPRLRRWDQKGTNQNPLADDGTVQLTEVPASSDAWLGLSYGVQVQFVAPEPGEPANRYRTGDFWLIPARTAVADVLWPRETDASGATVPAARPPDGVEHHYAPLAYLTVNAAGTVDIPARFVRVIPPAAQCPPAAVTARRRRGR